MSDTSEHSFSPGSSCERRVTMQGPLVLPALHAIGLDLMADAVACEDPDTEYADFLVGLDEPNILFPDLPAVQAFADILLGWEGQTDRAVQQIMYDFPEQIAVPLIQERKNYAIVAGMLGDQLHFQADFMEGMEDIAAVDDVARELQNPEQWLQP